MEWIDKSIQEIDNFPRANWEEISEYTSSHFAESELHDIWCSIARYWLEKINSNLPEGYSIHESDNFLLLTSEADRYVSLFLPYLERTLKKIQKRLDGITSDEGFGKHVVIIFDDLDHYYDYVGYYYPEEGDFSGSSGMYLNRGYGHFVFPHQELTYAESVAAHEMTHALLAHLPLPLWLNEGMAVNIEDSLTGSAPLTMDAHTYKEHMEFWGEKEIQEFWSGDSFLRPDNGQKLSYHLAQMAVISLSKDFDTFRNFTLKAEYKDGGESAAIEIYGGSLGNLMLQFLGEGSWTPNPEIWDHTNTDTQIV